MNRFRILAAISCWSIGLVGQTPVTRYSSLIVKDEMKQNLEILASDALEGRQTGSRGQKMAAALISHYFEQEGLQPPNQGSFLQRFNLYAPSARNSTISKGDIRLVNFTEFVAFNNWDSHVSLSVVYAGSGSVEELYQIDVEGKAVVVWLNGLSFSTVSDISRRLNEAGAEAALFYLDVSSREFHQFSSAVQASLQDEAFQLKEPQLEPTEIGLFYVHDTFLSLAGWDEKKLKTCAQSKRGLKKISPSVMEFESSFSVKILPTENVLGFLEGTDKKEEVLVISAHYDHIGLQPNGTDKIHNGADDDGSGTVAVMQIARAFSEAKKQGLGPRRSILFVAFTAEEWGLYGSEYYVVNPVIPLTQTVANLNIDMIGRTDPLHENEPDYVYVIGSDKLSTELHEINERNNSSFTQLTLDYTYNDENHPSNLYKRSDHWNFARYHIPVIFYFDGIHEDYHQPSDEVEKIDFDILEKRTKAIFNTAWEIVNRQDRLEVDR